MAGKAVPLTHISFLGTGPEIAATLWLEAAHGARVTFGPNACPKDLYVRKLANGTLAFINLDTANAITYVGASDISKIRHSNLQRARESVWTWPSATSYHSCE